MGGVLFPETDLSFWIPDDQGSKTLLVTTQWFSDKVYVYVRPVRGTHCDLWQLILGRPDFQVIDIHVKMPESMPGELTEAVKELAHTLVRLDQVLCGDMYVAASYLIEEYSRWERSRVGLAD